MNKLLIYCSICIVSAAIIIFAFLGNGSFYRVITNEDKTKVNGMVSTASAAPATNVAPLDIKIKNVVVNKTNDEKSANIQVAFDVHNPNINTMILDGIRYNVYVDNALITSGNIGTEAPEDVIRSQQGFPIIGNSVVTLKDTQAAQRNNVDAASWDKMIAGGTAAADRRVSYVVNGTYSFRQTANLAASGGINEFNLKFP
jgi:hypothetical protein